MDEAWLLQALKKRNSRETAPFLLLQEAYDRLLLQVDTLQARLEVSDRAKASLEQQIDEQSTVSGSTAGKKGNSGVAYSAAIKSEARVRDKLEKLQEEYNKKLKEEAEEKEIALKVSRELSDLKDEHSRNLATIAKLEEEKSDNDKTIQHLQNECDEANSRASLAEKQYEGLKLTIRSLQSENDQLQKENRQLEVRVISDKEKLVSEMNSLTELVESLKKERDMLRSLQNRETKKNSWFGSGNMVNAKPPNDRSTSAPIEEDPTRKFGDLKIALPSEPKFSLPAHTPDGVCVRYDSSGSGINADLVVTAGTDATVKVFDTSSGVLKSTLRGSAGHPFLSCDIAGHLVAGGGSDKTCRVWTLKTDRMVHQLVGHQHKISAVRFCGSGEAIVTASADRSLKVWDISRTTYKQLVTLRHGSTPNCVDVGTDSFSAISGHQDGGLRCWDLRTGDRTSDWKGIHEGSVTSVRLSPVDATKVLSNGLDSCLRVIDLRTGNVVETFQDTDLTTTQTWSSAAWSPNGRFVATGSNATGIVLVWNILSGALNKVHATPSTGDEALHTGIVGVDWCRGGPSGQQFATLDRRGKLILWA